MRLIAFRTNLNQPGTNSTTDTVPTEVRERALQFLPSDWGGGVHQQLRDARAKLNQQAASSGSTADVDSVSNGIGSGHGDLRKPNHHQDAQFNGVEAAAKASEREALRAVIRKEMQAELGSPLAPNEVRWRVAAYRVVWK